MRGSGTKLDAREAERASRTSQTAGRDLVLVAASAVEGESAKRGLALTPRGSTRGRTVVLDACEAGRVASGRLGIQGEIGTA